MSEHKDKIIKAQEELIAGLRQMCVAYRVGNQRTGASAADKIMRSEAKLEKLMSVPNAE